MRRIFVIAVMALAFVVTDASARSPFNATIVQSGKTLNVGFNKVANLLDTMTRSYLNANFPGGYSEIVATTFTLDYRGLPIVLAFDGGTNLTLTIASTGLSRTFSGQTRDASQTLLENWFKTNGGSEVTKLMQSLVANTSNDPIAGNPQSLQASMVSSDFADGTGIGSNESIANIEGKDGTATNTIGFGLDYMVLGSGGLSSKKITIPLKYTKVSKSDPRRKYIFRLPISQTDLEGAKSYQVGFGVLFVLPINQKWTLSPSFSYGLGGSIDLGSAAQMISGSLSSNYVIQKGKNTFSIGNMIGHYKTMPLKYGDYNIDPDIANTVFRNGVMMSVPLGSEDKGKHAQFFVVDTRYTGTKLKIDQYNEFGAAYGFSRKFRIGVTYILATDATGYSFNLGYKF